MFNKILWIIGPIALIYLTFLSLGSDSYETSLTANSIKFTQDICLPALTLEDSVESDSFRTKLTKIIPSEYTLEPTKPSSACTPYRVVKDGTPVRVIICQKTPKKTLKKLVCHVGGQRSPKNSLKTRTYLNSISELSGWKSHYPNRFRPSGEPNTLVSRYLCRPMHLDDTVNAVVISQGRSVTLYEADCSQLDHVTR